MTASPGKLVRQVGSVSAATLVSRVLGYARDALVAYAFGGGHLTDAFYAAFRIPNLFRRLLGEGSLTAAFVPVFSDHLSHGRRDRARECFHVLFTALTALLVVLVVLGLFFAPALTHLVAWGFKSDPEKFALTVDLTRTMFPFLLFVCLAALSSGALNALGRFFVPSVAPAMLSVAEIGFVLLLASRFQNALYGLAVSAVVGGALHFGLLLPLLRKEDLWPRWRWEPSHPDLKRVALALLPAVWGMSMDQINAFVDTICASFLVEGSVTALYNSNRLMQFPLALFGIATSTAALPALAHHAARNDHVAMKDTLNLSLRLILFTILPAMAGLILLGVPVTELLFEHGRFTHRETLLTVSALAAYCLGLPAYAGVKVLASAFYSMKDTRTPVRVATWCLLINMAGNVTLMWKWGVGGLAISTTLAATANAAFLMHLLRKRIGLLGGRRLLKTLLQSAAALVPMVLAAGGIVYGLGGSLLWRVPLGVVAGALTYAACARAMGMDEWRHAWDMLRRKAEPPAG
jgi:putative peptidoglycan lipid II flippase